jgi:hypothetical protein
LRLNTGVVLKGLVSEYWQHNPHVQSQRKTCREMLLNGLVLNCGNMPLIQCLVYIYIYIPSIVPCNRASDTDGFRAHMA